MSQEDHPMEQVQLVDNHPNVFQEEESEEDSEEESQLSNLNIHFTERAPLHRGQRSSIE